MQIKDLSKELDVQNRDMISFLKGKGYKVSSHMQAATDEMVDDARAYFSKPQTQETVIEELTEDNTVDTKTEKNIPEERPIKKFAPDDQIPCKSVVPYKMNQVSYDGNVVYHWEYFGDVDYVLYKDLQSWRRKDIITKPYVIILDEDLCWQWRRELGNAYKKFLGVDYPEEFFEIPDEKFDTLLRNADDVFKDVIKTTAMSMIRNENYPSVNKIRKIDEILGTCIMEFL